MISAGRGSRVRQRTPSEERDALDALSARGRTVATFSDPATAPEGRALAESDSAPDEFPMRAWLKMVSKCARGRQQELLGPMRAEGYAPLRQAVAAHLAAARGVRCDWQQVIITSSTQQSLDLLARLLLDSGDAVCCENPCYAGARAAFRFAEARLLPIAVDELGADFEALTTSSRAARLAYVTPSHQYPLGITMSLDRRLELLRWAEQGTGWIFEDDYDSEFRYVGRPIMSVQGLDERRRVIYSGSLNKLLFPAIRLAYIVVPEALVDPFGHAVVGTAGPAPTLSQAAAAEFISAGHLATHIRRTRERYRERRGVLLDALERELGGAFQVISADAGMHVAGWLAPGFDDVDIARRASERGLEVPALSTYYIADPARSGLLIHFARVAPPVITRAIESLAKCIAESARRKAG
jgi:GntR family transcriptional regulator/MocR family aminotransferase